MRHILYTLCVFLFLTGSLFAEKLNINQILEATCRVNAGGHGTGTCISKKGNKYFILTNAHVVDGKKNVTVEFFRKGYKTVHIPGKVIWTSWDKTRAIDFAIIQVYANYFGEYPPRIIPLVNKQYTLKKNQYFITTGCPLGRWARGLEGHILNVNNIVYFTPPPHLGQSGSGIFVNVVNKKGETNTKLAAIITWYYGEHYLKSNGYSNSYGGAIPIKYLYEAIYGDKNKVNTISDKLIPIPNQRKYYE